MLSMFMYDRIQCRFAYVWEPVYKVLSLSLPNPYLSKLEEGLAALVC